MSNKRVFFFFLLLKLRANNCVVLIVECFRPHQFSSEIVTIFCEVVRNMHRDYSVLLYYHSQHNTVDLRALVRHVIIPEIATKLRGYKLL